MFGSTFGAARIDSGNVKLILTCLVLYTRIDFAFRI